MPKYLVTQSVSGAGGTKFSELAPWGIAGGTLQNVSMYSVNSAKYAGASVNWYGLGLYGSLSAPGQYFYNLEVVVFGEGTVSMSYPYSVTATSIGFTPLYFPSGVYTYFTITAVATAGYAFDHWALQTPDGSSASIGSTLTINYTDAIINNTKIYAIFVPLVSFSQALCTSYVSLDNMNTTTYRNGDPITNITTAAAWNQSTTGAWCYYSNSASNIEYGKLYNMYALYDPRGMVPVGARPLINQPGDPMDLDSVIDCLGGATTAGGQMKETGLTHWNSPNTGATNVSYFGALGAGEINAFGSFVGQKTTAAFWGYMNTSSSVNIWPNIGTGEISEYRLFNNSSSVTVNSVGNSPSSCVGAGLPRWVSVKYNATNSLIFNWGFECANNMDVINIYQSSSSIGPWTLISSGAGTPTTRTVSATIPALGTYTYFRVTGTYLGASPTAPTERIVRYPTVANEGKSVRYSMPVATASSQIWMGINLDVSQYRNGDVIPQITNSTAWAAATTGAWCWYGFNYASYGTIYGKLYNRYAITDVRGLAPLGWHIPTVNEFESLFTYLGGSSVAAGKLKSSSLNWTAPNVLDPSGGIGFQAEPSGYVTSVGAIGNVNNSAFYWTSTGVTGSAYAYRIEYNSVSIIPLTGQGDNLGYAVRCVRNSIGNSGIIVQIQSSGLPMSGYLKIIRNTSGEIIYDRYFINNVSVNQNIYVPPETYTVYVFHYTSTEGALQARICDNGTGGTVAINTNITTTYSASMNLASNNTNTVHIIMAGATFPLCPVI